MNIIRWTPWKEMETLSDRMNRLFEGTLIPSQWKKEENGLSAWAPVVDVFEKDNKIMIKAELPGVDKKDIHVNLEKNVLTLSGERNYENEVNEENFYRKERAFGRFERSFTVPAGLDPEKIKAEYTDGILHIEIPKPEEEKTKKISVH